MIGIEIALIVLACTAVALSIVVTAWWGVRCIQRRLAWRSVRRKQQRQRIALRKSLWRSDTNVKAD